MKKKTKLTGLMIVLIILAVWGVKTYRELQKPAIGLIKVEGGITTSLESLETIKDYEEDETIKAVLVRIDSPGGVVGPSQEIYQRLLKLKGKKPIIVSMGALGASGAYYIACAADTIYALPGTLTGSIGVLMEFVDVSEGIAKLGIKAGSITSGNLKDAGSPFRPMTEVERAYFKDVIDDTHAQFVEAVAKGRRLPIDKVRELANGRIYTGRQAKNLGLVDRLGGYDQALEEAKRLAGITGEPRIVQPAEPLGFFELAGRFLDGYAPHSLKTGGGSLRTVRLEYRIF
ncbi:MAG TPA: signal peptide peptidase SppA [Deltaproteobacteria bacterium]|nr:signal peptide peptidase SppA [Deltaproteobacteria bacterium]